MTTILRSLLTRTKRSILPITFPRRLPISRPSTHFRYFSSVDPIPPNGDRPDQDRLNKLVLSIDSLINGTKDRAQVGSFVHQWLDNFFALALEPHIAYSPVISCLIQRGYFTEATNVYQRMIKDGALPSAQTKAEMLAVALSLCDTDPEIMQALDIVVKDPLYTEDHFLQLLQVMATMDVSPNRILRVVEQFVEARGDGYSPSESMVTKLVDAQTRAGLLEDAFESIVQYGDKSSPSPTSPYVTVMRALTQTKSSDKEAFTKTLEVMKENQILPDIAVLNALISRELRQRSLYMAFSIYHVIISMSLTTPLSPNPSTFGTLFSVLTKLYKHDTRSARSRPFKRPDNAVPPRQLYRDMLFFRERTSFDITSNLLNIALRAFIQTQDYAGAYVVLNAFKILRLPVTAKTYFIVMRHLMYRIRWDVLQRRKEGETRWGDIFMGITSATALKRLQINEAFAEKVLESASRPKFPLDAHLFGYIPTGDSAYTTPTLAMIDGDVPVPRSLRLDIVPLQRLLCRAILAGFKGYDPAPAEERVWKVIAEAKADMFPGREHPYAKNEESVQT